MTPSPGPPTPAAVDAVGNGISVRIGIGDPAPALTWGLFVGIVGAGVTASPAHATAACDTSGSSAAAHATASSRTSGAAVPPSPVVSLQPISGITPSAQTL